MKKTLLATAIAGALGVSAAAQAATVYDQDGTRLDIYGRIAMGIEGGGDQFDSEGNEIDNGPEFVDVFSRLGARMSHEINSDLSAFGHVEWRFRGDERSGEGIGAGDDAFREVRQSYIGLRSDSYGTLQGGNFDSFFLQSVTSPFDVYINRGLEFAGHPTQSRGDSLGYITPNLAGFQVYLQAKLYDDRGAIEPDGTSSVVASQGGAVYEINNLRLAAGYVDDVVEGGGNDELRYGATVAYEFVPGFSGRLGYEGRDDNDTLGGGFDKYGLGMTYAINDWAFNLDYYNIDEDDAVDDRNAWAAGAYYKLASNFDVFLELNDADISTDRDTSLGEITDDFDDVYWLTGARYHF